jgi:hypothetical protein
MQSQSGVPSAALQGCLEVCSRCNAVVETLAITDRDGAVYRVVGPHVRHCLDHFLAFLTGLPEGRIDYDARERDPGVETDPNKALDVLDMVTVRLEGLSLSESDQAISVVQLACPDAAPSMVPSSVDRELIFLSSHTVHHLALMIEIAGAKGVKLPSRFGVAFSTARYREHGDEGRR